MDGSGPKPTSEAGVSRRRSIVDRAVLSAALGEVAGRGLSAGEERAAVLDLLKEVLAAGRDEVRRRFDAGASGTEVVRANCFLVDQVVRAVYDHVTEHLYPLWRNLPGRGKRTSALNRWWSSDRS